MISRGALVAGAAALLLLALYQQQQARAREAAEDDRDPLGGLDEWGFGALAELEAALGFGPDLDEMRAIMSEGNVRAFLAMIREAEGTSSPEGYRMHFGGELFAHFADHPRRAVTRTLGDRPITSTAAGAYQILERTWDEAAAALKLPDFSPQSQDAAAVWLIRRRGALDDVRAGRFEAAVAKCAREWASLPGSPYGQPVKSLAAVRETYLAAGGVLA